MLDKYAGTIAQVFEKLAKVYDDGSGDSGNDIVCDIERIMDADTCAEIIEAAKKVEGEEDGGSNNDPPRRRPC